VEWIHLDQVGNQRRAVVNTAVNLLIPFLTSLAHVS
jgi:hypothetical protein